VYRYYYYPLKFHKTQSGLQELRHATTVRIFNIF
jgi:hypothetical protein